MSKMFDFCIEIDNLSKETGRSITEIIENLSSHENELAEICMVTGIPYNYICRKYVTSGFDITTVQPQLIKSDYSSQNRTAMMGELADKFVRGEISTHEYFERLGELKEGRGA